MPDFTPRPQAFKRIRMDDLSLGMMKNIPSLEMPKGSARLLQNCRLRDNGVAWRKGHTKKGTTNGANVVDALGVLRNNDLGTLFNICNGKLRKWTGAAFADTDLSGLSTQKKHTIETMQSKSEGTALLSGKTTSATTARMVEDSGQLIIESLPEQTLISSYSGDYPFVFSKKDSLGNIFIVYADNSSTEIKIKKYKKVSGSYTLDTGFGTSGTVTITTTTFNMSSIFIDSSDRLIVVWHPTAAYDVSFVRITNITGSVSSVITSTSAFTKQLYRTKCIEASNGDYIFFTSDGTALQSARFNNNLVTVYAMKNFQVANVLDFDMDILSNNNIVIFTNIGILYESDSTGVRINTKAAASSNLKNVAISINSIDDIWIIYADSDRGKIPYGKVFDSSYIEIIPEFNISTDNIFSAYSYGDPINIETDSNDNIHISIFFNTIDEGWYYKYSVTGVLNLSKRIGTYDKESFRVLGFIDSGTYTFLSMRGTDVLVNEFIDNPVENDFYLGKILEITSGDAKGEMRMISGSTPTKYYVEGYYDPAPTDGDTFEIHDVADFIFIVDEDADGMYTHKHDGTTKTSLSSLKKAVDIAQHIGRLFYAYSDGNIQWSERGIGETVPVDNYMKVSGNGDPIIKIVEATDDILVIYKKYSIDFLYGSQPLDFRLVKSISDFGCRARNSVATEGKLQFFLSDRGIELLNTLATNTLAESIPLSEPIHEYLFDGTHSDADFEDAAGWIENNKYFIDIGERRYVYDILQSVRKRRSVWTVDTVPEDIRANCAVSYDRKSLIGSASTSGQVYAMEDGNDDDGTAIALDIQFPDVFLNAPDLQGVIDRITVYLDEISSSSQILSIQTSFDGGAWNTAKTMDIAADIKKNFIERRKTEFFSLRITAQCNTSPVKIGQVEFHVSSAV